MGVLYALESIRTPVLDKIMLIISELGGEAPFLIIAIAVYLIAMVFVGVAYSRASKGGADNFYLGGRQLGPVVTAMSAEASDMSSWLLMVMATV